MAVENPATTEALIVKLLGQLGVDLRLDDSVDAADDLAAAVDIGTTDLWFYLAARYAATDIAASTWAQWHATYFAVRFLCERRNNDVPTALEKACKRREDQLLLIQKGKAHAPYLANSRRPAAVTTYHVDGRRYNNQERVDTNRSTGKAKGYVRPTDTTSPDGR